MQGGLSEKAETELCEIGDPTRPSVGLRPELTRVVAGGSAASRFPAHTAAAPLELHTHRRRERQRRHAEVSAPAFHDDPRPPCLPRLESDVSDSIGAEDLIR